RGLLHSHLSLDDDEARPVPPPLPLHDALPIFTAGDFSSFLTSGHLVGYCDIAPLIRRSGSPSVANSPHSISQQATQKCTVPINMGTWLTHKHFSCRTVLANNPFRVIRGSP